MATKMKNLVLTLILFATMIFTVGYIGEPLNSQKSSGNSTTVEITQLEQINKSLQKNPVFLRIGAKWCSHCQSLQPILEKMATEYAGNATIATIDVDQSPDLAKYFGVEFFPDSCVIVGIENGSYIYMQEDGNVSMNRFQARFVGLNEITGPNEETFKKVLDLALLQKGKTHIKAHVNEIPDLNVYEPKNQVTCEKLIKLHLRNLNHSFGFYKAFFEVD